MFVLRTRFDDLGHFHESNRLSLNTKNSYWINAWYSCTNFGLVYFFASSDLLLLELMAKFGSNGGVSGGMIDNGWRVLCAIEALLIIDVVSVVIEPLGVVVDKDDADVDDTDDVGLTIVFINRTGTSLVKWSICGIWEFSTLKGKP